MKPLFKKGWAVIHPILFGWSFGWFLNLMLIFSDMVIEGIRLDGMTNNLLYGWLVVTLFLAYAMVLIFRLLVLGATSMPTTWRWLSE